MLARDGASNATIGSVLGLAEPTVKQLMWTAMKRLGARTRTHAVVLAIATTQIPLD